MAYAYLQQCGEIGPEELSFSFGVECAINLANSLASGSDSDSVFTDSGYGVAVFLQRRMAPGWWAIEMSINDPDADGRGYYRFASVWAYSDASFPSSPNIGDTISANIVQYKPSSALNTNPVSNLIKLEGEFCQRIVFRMSAGDWVNVGDDWKYPPEGNPWTVNVTGTWIACLNCPDPIP